MNLFNRALEFVAKVALPPVALPKAKPKPQGLPAYRTNTEASKAALPKNDRGIANLDRPNTVRLGRDTYEVVRGLVAVNPDLSSAASSALRVGIPEGYRLYGYDMDGNLDRDICLAAGALLRRLTYMGNIDGSMGTQMTLQSLSEQLSLELLTTGGMCLEVALDAGRVPASMNPISVTTLKFYEDTNSFKIKQVIGGKEIDLDLPTIIYVSTDQFLTEVYPRSPYEAAVPPVLTDLEFTDDVRKALKRAVIPRLMSEIDSEAVLKQTPPEIRADPTKLAAYKNSIIEQVQNVVNGLSPEDALVSFNTVKYSFIDGGLDPSMIIERVQRVLNSKLAAGAHTMPVVLGHGGTSNAASTESLLYLKHANHLRVKLNEVYSRALTVAVRLLGLDGYVEFEYDELDLRPKTELEAYFAMKQSRVLELLSFGFITDDMASIMLTRRVTPDGFKPLSGTLFKVATPSNTANPNSQTSAMDKTLNPGTPKGEKSQNGGQ